MTYNLIMRLARAFDDHNWNADCLALWAGTALRRVAVVFWGWYSIMCDFGNCTRSVERGKRKILITTVAANGYVTRGIFCCEDHASRWLAKQVRIPDPSFNGTDFYRILARSIYDHEPTEAQVEKVRAEYSKFKGNAEWV